MTICPDILQNIGDQEYVTFTQEVAVHMKSLLMRHCDIRYLRLLSDKVLPQTESFTWLGQSTNSVESGEEELEDLNGGSQEELHFLEEDLNILNGIFPNLKVLRLSACQITGKYLSHLTSLKQVALNECQCLESDNFREVFQELKLRKFDIMEDCDEINCCDLVEVKKCPSLEHIKIADYHLCFDTDIINDILGMPRLRKLSIYSRNFVFDVMERISRTRLKDIVAFKFNGVLHNFERFFRELTHMRLLKKLSFYNCRGQDVEGVRDHMLLQISRQFTDLEEIHLCSCDLESEKGVLSFVQNCHQLRLINVTNSRKSITESLVWRCMELMKKQKWRTTDVQLWLRGTDVDRSILEVSWESIEMVGFLNVVKYWAYFLSVQKTV